MSLQFVSVIREGLSLRLPFVDAGATSAALHDKALASALALQASATVGTQTSVAVSLQLFGPGHVSGIDHALVLRSDPPPDSQRFDTSLFVQVEFDDPGLPWMYTPLRPNGAQLRPWVALVVLEQTGPDTPLDLEPARHGRLPVLTVTSAAELPPIDETWAWAHGQVTVADAGATAVGDLGTVIAQHPEASLSRLLCPRRLSPGKRYCACVVPTFEAGRTAGLGDPPADTVNPAWGADASFPLRLPVYYQWQFYTGEADNFEQALRRLRRSTAPAEAGRVVDASDPGRPEVVDPAAQALPLAGALRPDGLSIARYTGPGAAGYAQLARAGQVVVAPGGAAYPVVNLPLYAGKQLGVTDPASAPVWVRELNTDPRNRAAAALGARIVRFNQEALMASAWDQVGDVEEANRRRRRARLGRETSARIVARHIEPLDDTGRLAVLAPAFSRLTVAGSDRTIAGLVGESRVPAMSLGGSYTARLRPGGRIARKLLRDPQDGLAVASGIDDGQIQPDRSQSGRPGGLVTLEGVLAVVDSARGSVRAGGVRNPVDPSGIDPTVPGRLRVATRVTGSLSAATTIRVFDATGLLGPSASPMSIRGEFSLPPGTAIRRIDPAGLTSEAIQSLPGTLTLNIGPTKVDVTAAHQQALADLFAPVAPATTSTGKALDIQQVAQQALAAIDPASAIVRALESQITVPAELAAPDPLDEVLAAPQFPSPLSVDLARLAPDMLLPGLEQVQNDRVFAVVSNNSFVQALLAGANHEIMRELRWRDFPTDERGTSFHRFWRADADEIADLNAIRTGHLGDAVSGGSGEVVVVIRSELLSRFPGTQVLAVAADVTEATPKPDFSAPELPVFRGQIAPDVAYFGFGFDEQTATSSPGRYLVFQQPFGASSFGLDLDSPLAGFPANARDLAWSHVTMAGDYVRAQQLGPPFADNGATWGSSAADQAASTLQQPIRAAVHFRDLLKGP